jgi:hypothetical protein
MMFWRSNFSISLLEDDRRMKQLLTDYGNLAESLPENEDLYVKLIAGTAGFCMSWLLLEGLCMPLRQR